MPVVEAVLLKLAQGLVDLAGVETDLFILATKL
jgi:hypothetical protein